MKETEKEVFIKKDKINKILVSKSIKKSECVVIPV